jgi:hypothetical protein
MANVKISDLAETTTASTSDVVEIETSGGVSKKITKGNLYGSMAQQDADAVNISGGTINGTTIGAGTQSTGRFSTLSINNTSPALVLGESSGSGICQINARDSGSNDIINIRMAPDATPNFLLRMFFSAAWHEIFGVDSGLVKLYGDYSITASTTQTQGQEPLIYWFNIINVCANANDVVTLPEASAGSLCFVINEGVQTLQVFPASGDRIEAGAVDASTTIASGDLKIFIATGSVIWRVV